MTNALTKQPRAIGRLGLTAGPSLERLHQSGAMRALFPRGQGLTAVMLNTSGGVTGGDRFETEIHATTGADLTITTQAAERFYRAQPSEIGRITTKLIVDADARLAWLPQETILFDVAAVHRSLSVDLAENAEALIVEPMVFGRHAMGERLTKLSLRDQIDIRRDGKLVFADRTVIDGNADHILAHPVVAGGGGAQVALILVSPRADAYVDALRQLMPGTGGVSLIRPGVLFARMVAEDGFVLRQHLIPVIEKLGQRVPRTWAL